MKTKNIIYPFLALMTIGSVCGAESSVLINHSININESEEEWVLVKEENNIQIYFSEFKINEISYLKIRFNNASGMLKNFSWSLLKENNIIIDDYNTQIPLNNFFDYFDETSLIIIENGKSLNDFSIIINIK